MKPDPLAELRDIHLPEPVSWWPPAPGWWILLVLVLLMAASLIWWLHRRRQQREKPKQFSQREVIDQALIELDALQQCARDNSDANALLADLSALLRRVAMRLKPDDACIAGLSGEAWLAWLDAQWDRETFSHGEGRPLLDAHFQRHAQVDIDALLRISRDWLEVQR